MGFETILRDSVRRVTVAKTTGRAQMGTKLNYLLQGLVVACLAVTSPVQASILGGQTVQTLDFHGIASDMTSIIGPGNTVVGPGTELTDFAGIVNIDFSDTNILITLINGSHPPFSDFSEILRFVDVNGTIPNFAVNVNPATNLAGFDASRLHVIDFSGNTDVLDVTLTALGLTTSQGQQISLDLTGAATFPVPAPEPATIVLLVLGIAFLSLHKIFVQYIRPTLKQGSEITLSLRGTRQIVVFSRLCAGDCKAWHARREV